MISEVNKTKIFISGAFQETGNDLSVIKESLNSIGFNAVIKDGTIKTDSESLIRACDYFLTVIGIEEPVIKTTSGESLPQLELNFAIRRGKPIVCFMKHPQKKGVTDKQEFFRNSMKIRMKESVQSYEETHELLSLVKNIPVRGFEAISSVLRSNKVFMSYSSKDRHMVERIVKQLRKAGILTFYNQHNLGVGDNLKEAIQKAITEVGYVVICLSSNAFASKWVLDEIAWVIESEKHLAFDGVPFILPVKVGEFQIPPELNHLKKIKYANVCADFESGVSELIGAIM